MSDTTSELILTELRELRSLFNEFAQRITALETDNRAVMGNGQPGRMTLAEMAIARLEEWRWWLISAVAGVAAVVSCVAWLIKG
jgi:hypothetical protein